jgi:hypothetical protein
VTFERSFIENYVKAAKNEANLVNIGFAITSQTGKQVLDAVVC